MHSFCFSFSGAKSNLQIFIFYINAHHQLCWRGWGCGGGRVSWGGRGRVRGIGILSLLFLFLLLLLGGRAGGDGAVV